MEHKSDFDLDKFLSLIDHDLELFRSLVDVFAEDWPEVIAELKRALKENDASGVEKFGHRIKGNIRNFYSERLAEMAMRVEMAGKNSQLEGVMIQVSALEEGLKDLQFDLQQSLLKIKSDKN